MYLIFFIHSFVDEYWGWFHVLVIANSADMNIGVYISFQKSFLQIYGQEGDCWILWWLSSLGSFHLEQLCPHPLNFHTLLYLKNTDKYIL